MKTTEHTPEPWRYDPRPAQGVVYIVDAEGYSIGEWRANPNALAGSHLLANAARIVACVNACEGIDDADLKKMQGRTVIWYGKKRRPSEGVDAKRPLGCTNLADLESLRLTPALKERSNENHL